MPYLSIFFISFTIALSGALMPGPLLSGVIAQTPRQGFKSGPLIILGHAILEVLMVALLVLGLGYFLGAGWLIKLISILGALILFYFGATMLLSLKSLTLNTTASKTKPANLALLGITLSLANPYWTIWWLSIGLGLVLAAQQQGILAVAIFFLGHILADFSWYSLVSLTLSKGRGFISLRVYKIIIAVCALSLIAFALYFLVNSNRMVLIR